VIVRDARASELAGIGDLRVAAYRAGGLLSVNPGYAEVLRGLGVSGTAEVLVAEKNGRIVGTVMLEPFYRFSEIARSLGEAEVRALAVAPREQGRGAGRALVAAVIERATVRGLHRLLLSANPAMTAAQHLCRRAGFTRLPELDWSPAPGLSLLAFGLVLPQGGASTDRHRPQRSGTSYTPMR
jgi:GNAT superfamily N-acetyltransferase